ncbi:MAG: hypothetical protein LQ347_000181 [Umbilicaria vellea]|nr:MAG: hypothetical protein LQ347_000181 [Umbilicaria vellea]
MENVDALLREIDAYTASQKKPDPQGPPHGRQTSTAGHKITPAYHNQESIFALAGADIQPIGYGSGAFHMTEAQSTSRNELQLDAYDRALLAEPYDEGRPLAVRGLAGQMQPSRSSHFPSLDLHHAVVKPQTIDLDHTPPVVQGIQLISLNQLPDRFRSVFPFLLFNPVQSKCFETIYKTNDNLVLSAPTGSGKTVILELAICRLVAGFKTDQYKLRNVQNANIVITTPEKWDSMTRKWKDHSRLMQLVKLFLIDEVHILGDTRGATLEAVVSRMKSVGSHVRFVALSATVPNSNDIATWLGKDSTTQHMPAVRERFGEEFRPVKLQKIVYGFACNGNDFVFEKVLDTKLPDIIAKHSRKKPIMVFCFTRKSTVSTAKALSNLWATKTARDRHWSAPTQRIAVEDLDLRRLGTVNDLHTAKRWLAGTFLYVRLAQNPSHYKLDGNTVGRNLDDRIEQICVRDIALLQETNLVTFSAKLSGTEFGEAMARYYVRFETMKILLSLGPRAKMSEILSALVQADEFHEVRLRAGEKNLYKEFNNAAGMRFPIKVNIALAEHKRSLIIQSELAGIEFPAAEQFAKHKRQFQQDKAILFSHAQRLIRCVVDCQLYLHDSVTVRHTLELARSFGARVWDNSPLQMKQIPQIGGVAVRKLAVAGINSIEILEATEAHRLELLLNKQNPFGMKILASLKDFPKLRVSVKMMGKDCRSGQPVRVKFLAEIRFINDKAPVFFHRKPIFVCFLAERSDGHLVDFRRLSANKLGTGQEILISADLLSGEQYITCYVMCDEIGQYVYRPSTPSLLTPV